MILQLRCRASGSTSPTRPRRSCSDGEPLADALDTLQRGGQAVPMEVNPATESLYIANPLTGTA